MPIPDIFYFWQTQSKVQYGPNPKGAPNIDRLLTGRPAFPMAMPALEKKQKKLVISYWNVGALSAEARNAVAEAIDQLITAGFSIYEYHENAVIPLADSTDFLRRAGEAAKDREKKKGYQDAIAILREKVSSTAVDEKQEIMGEITQLENCVAELERPKAIFIPSLEAVRQAAVLQQGITHDELQILDEYWFKHLVSGDVTPGPRILQTSQIPELTPENLKQVIQLLQSSTPKLEKIILDTFPSYPNETIGPLLDALLADESLEVEIPETIKAVRLSNLHMAPEKLVRILEAAKHAEDINLFGYASDAPEVSFMFESNYFPNLKALSLARSNAAWSLSNLLEAAPNLESLHIVYCEHLEGSVPVKQSTIQHLSQLGFDGIAISPENCAILRTAPNLTEDSQLELEAIEDYHKACLEAGQAFTSTQSAPTNPQHDPNVFKDFKPTSDTVAFQFKGQNKTKNQGMLIEKLSQYLLVSDAHLALIPKIQDGICAALAQYFSGIETSAWDDFIHQAQHWNGHDTVGDGLKGHFDALVKYIHQYQLAQGSVTYLGDSLEVFLQHVKAPIVLSNPWHDIAVKPIGNGQFQVYDPNYVTGYQVVEAIALPTVIHEAIGDLVSVKGAGAVPPCRIDNPDVFIETGGLIALIRSKNIDEILQQLPNPAAYSYQAAALDGLYLRGTSGEPAWVLCLLSRHPGVKAFGSALLNQKEAQESFVAEMVKSTEALTGFQMQAVITAIIQNGVGSAHQQALIDAMRASANKKSYETALETWDKSSKLTTPAEYLQSCLHHEKKRLIELTSTTALDDLGFALEKQARDTGQPVFYIDKPEDLICAAAYVENQANQGILRKGPGGALYDFLQANQENSPILIVNYEHFTAEDIVKFNGLLDKLPHADGTPLPAHTRVIGLINRNKPDCYAGSDFYSRFDRTETCPLTKVQLRRLITEREVEVIQQPPETAAAAATPEAVVEDKYVINLYHAADWKERLLGRWLLDGSQLTYVEGELTQALATGKAIEIQNGLWFDVEFQRFWKQALSGGVLHAGSRIAIPEAISVTRPLVDGYDWSHLQKAVAKISPALSDDKAAKTLNSGTLLQFIERYELDGKTLVRRPGFLALSVEEGTKQCTVNITRSLGEDEFAVLLTEAARLGVTLDIHCAPGVVLPEAFGVTPAGPLEAETGLPSDLNNNAVINSSDPDTTIVMLRAAHAKESIKVTDISECTASDLLTRLDGGLIEGAGGEPRFEFTETVCALKRGLEQGETILLTGHYAPILLDELAVFILERERTGAPGKLILITPEGTDCTYVKQQCVHAVQAQEKLQCLDFSGEVLEKMMPKLETESLSQLKARGAFLTRNPSGNSDDAWLGMKALPGMPALTGVFDRKTSAAEAKAFTAARVKQVNDVLESAPHVFLTGLSGVGKSTFVEKELCQKGALYLSEEHILEWATDKSEQRKILFLDEANLSPSQWSAFEGLYNTPPCLLINGTWHELSAHHKVVFAGNPVHYGDERTLAPFFERHGNAVLFNPLPIAVIYEKVLKPILGEDDGGISERILEMYAFVCACSETEILISPRELEMIALLTRARSMENPSVDINDIAAHFIYQIAKPLVPMTQQAAFEQQFKPSESLDFPSPASTAAGTFLITDSRRAVTQQLDDLLGLRALRRAPATKDTLNEKQKYGGLGGLVLEGAPGIGKSELVIAALVARGYEEEHDFSGVSDKENPFYRMPVSMNLDEKEALLIKAFNEGAVVMIDEINSSPMMERLLNDLLMGKNPRAENSAPEKPGFMIIGTQNPTSMAGRRLASAALKRRLITTELPEYTTREIQDILIKKGVSPAAAQSMVETYESKRHEAISKHLEPVPNFRNLMTLADDHLQAMETLQERVSRDDTLLQKSPEEVVKEMKLQHLLHHQTDPLLSEEKAKQIFFAIYKPSDEADGSASADTLTMDSTLEDICTLASSDDEVMAVLNTLNWVEPTGQPAEDAPECVKNILLGFNRLDIVD